MFSKEVYMEIKVMHRNCKNIRALYFLQGVC